MYRKQTNKNILKELLTCKKTLAFRLKNVVIVLDQTLYYISLSKIAKHNQTYGLKFENRIIDIEYLINFFINAMHLCKYIFSLKVTQKKDQNFAQA